MSIDNFNPPALKVVAVVVKIGSINGLWLFDLENVSILVKMIVGRVLSVTLVLGTVFVPYNGKNLSAICTMRTWQARWGLPRVTAFACFCSRRNRHIGARRSDISFRYLTRVKREQKCHIFNQACIIFVYHIINGFN